MGNGYPPVFLCAPDTFNDKKDWNGWGIGIWVEK